MSSNLSAYNSCESINDIYFWPVYGTELWHNMHLTTIGGSHVDAFLNKSKYKTKEELFLEKINLVERDQNEACAWGILMEKFSQNYLQVIYGREVFIPGILFSFPLTYSADGIMLIDKDAANEEHYLVEIKTPYYRRITKNKKYIPKGYIMQMNQGLYMMRNILKKAIYLEAFYAPCLAVYNNQFILNYNSLPCIKKYKDIKDPLAIGFLTITAKTNDLYTNLVNYMAEKTNTTILDMSCLQKNALDEMNIFICENLNNIDLKHDIYVFSKDNYADDIKSAINIYYNWHALNKNNLRLCVLLYSVFINDTIEGNNESVISYIDDAKNFCLKAIEYKKLDIEERKQKYYNDL